MTRPLDVPADPPTEAPWGSLPPADRRLVARLREGAALRTRALGETPSLAGPAVELARRLRTRRRLGAVAGTALAVAAVTVPVLWNARPDHPIDPGPGRPATVASPSGGPVAPVVVRLPAVAALAAGASPRVAWFVKAPFAKGPVVVHLPDGGELSAPGITAAVPYGPGSILAAVPAAGSLVSLSVVGPAPAGPSGSGAVTLTPASLPIGSATSGRVAYWHRAGDLGILEERSGTDGLVLTKTATPAGESTFEPVGQLAPGVVLVAEQGPAGARAWRTTPEGRLEPIAGWSVPTAASERGGRYAGLATSGHDGPLCAQVRRAADDRLLWSACDRKVVGFSPDGRTALVVPLTGSGLGVGGGWAQLDVVDAATGSSLLSITGPAIDQVASEPSGAVLLAARDGTGSAVVRCTLDGTCARATPTIPVSGEPGDGYALASSP